MQRRDWAGTVLLACLVALAALLRNHVVFVVVFGTSAFLSAAVIGYDVYRGRRGPLTAPSAAHTFAASFLEEEGIRPSRWQRIRHPRTPVVQLPVRVPRPIREKYRARQDALQEFIDELENNARDLGFQVNDVQIYGAMFPGSAWERHRHLLNSEDLVWTREIVQDAYLRTHALNPKTRARYDAASATEVNDPDWKKLTDEELQERQDALSAVVAARSAIRQARDGENPGG